MTQDVTQWLAEIRILKQQMAEAQQERDRAYDSATNWQRLYETEAQQRRTEAALAQQRIVELKHELQSLTGRASSVTDEAAVAAIRADVQQLQPTELQERLIAALAERDRLAEALKTEQANHARTRKELTTALGDAIDQLKASESPAT